MSPFSCSRSQELSAALRAGYSSSAWEPSLREHVENCEQCGELVLVSSTLRAARAEAMSSARLGSPQLLWWRAQLRRRNEALDKLSQPTSIAGRVALLSTGLLAVVLLFLGRQQWAAWFQSQQGSPFRFDLLWSAIPDWSVLLMAMILTVLATLGGLAIYLASERD